MQVTYKGVNKEIRQTHALNIQIYIYKKWVDGWWCQYKSIGPCLASISIASLQLPTIFNYFNLPQIQIIHGDTVVTAAHCDDKRATSFCFVFSFFFFKNNFLLLLLINFLIILSEKPTSVVFGTHNLIRANDKTMRYAAKKCKHLRYVQSK